MAESVTQIIKAACEAAGLTVAEAESATRTRIIARKRFHAMAILRARGWSTPRIGEVLGGRDHTTVVHGLRMHERLTAEAAAKAGTI